MSQDESPTLDAELVRDLLGKIVLVGITFCEPDGSVIEHQQFFGRIKTISKTQIELEHPSTREVRSFPPDLSGYKKASPGEYRLKSTGEVVVDPDLIAQWTVTRPYS